MKHLFGCWFVAGWARRTLLPACLSLLKQGCPCHMAGKMARATCGHLVPMFWWGHCHGWPCALPTVFLFLPYHHLAPLASCSGVSISSMPRMRNITGEKWKAGSWLWCVEPPCGQRSHLTVRIWGASAVAERLKLYIAHPVAPPGKSVMIAAVWVLGGLTLTRRPVLNLLMLLLISALGGVVRGTPPGCCLPN